MLYVFILKHFLSCCVAQGVCGWFLGEGGRGTRNNSTMLNELCPQFHMRSVNTKACRRKTASCSRWQRQSACVWRTRVKGTGDNGEGIWISHLRGGSASLKSLISVSGRLTGDPSCCHRNFISFFFFEAGFFFFFFSIQRRFKTQLAECVSSVGYYI